MKNTAAPFKIEGKIFIITWKWTLHMLEYWPQINNTKANSNKENERLGHLEKKEDILFIKEKKWGCHQTLQQKKME